MGLSCALWATSLHQWARRYIRMTQPARCSPEKRARMRAYFANGADKMHIPWAVEGLPALLHLSLFLFFGGLAIFLFNIDHEVFICVVWWIGLFSMVYGLITLLPLIRQDSPYSAPLSIPAWFIYASMQYVTFKVLAYPILNNFTTDLSLRQIQVRRIRHLRNRILGGVEKAVEYTVSKKSSEIDVQILGWTIGALGDDNSLEEFFEAIPGFFDSKLVVGLERGVSPTFIRVFWEALDGFMGRTSSSNSVMESVKSRRVIICRDIMDRIPCPYFFKCFNLSPYFNQAPVSIEKAQAMTRWLNSNDLYIRHAAEASVAMSIPRIQEFDDRWIALVLHYYAVYGLSERELRNYVALGRNNALLGILIDFSRGQHIFPREWEYLEPLAEIDIRDTHPRLQHEFCTLWNDFVLELVLEAQNQGRSPLPIYILRRIRHLYIALHQGTDAAPTSFTASTDSVGSILFKPSSYPMCHISDHHPDPTLPRRFLTQLGDSPSAWSHLSTLGRSTVSTLVEKASIFAGPPLLINPTTPGEIGDPQAPATTSSLLPVLNSPRPGAAATAPQGVLPAAKMSHPQEGTTPLDIVEPCPELDISERLSTLSTPVPTPTLVTTSVFAPPILNKSLASCDESAASASNPLLLASSIVNFSILSSLPPSGVTRLLDTEFLSLFSSTTTFRPTGNDPMPRLRARGLVNTRSICFANAVLQLLVHSPPFLNMFRELNDPKGQRGVEDLETEGRSTPLLDATIKFFGEFVLREEPPTAQQVAAGKLMEDQAKKVHNAADSFGPSYLYGAMKGKRQLKGLLVCSYAMQRPAVTDLSWYKLFLNLYRTANNKMRRSFFASTSTRLTKSYLRYLLLLVAASQLMPHPE